MGVTWKKAMLIAAAAICLTGCGGEALNQQRQSMELEKLGEILVCVREEGSGTRQTFTQLVTDSDSSLENCHEADGNDAVLEYVSSNEGAIGYISGDNANVGQQCNIVRTQDKLSRPFLLVYIGELNGVEEDFLRYMQSAANARAASFVSDRTEGTIKIGGSSSMSEKIEKLAEAYMKVNENAKITVTTTDSADGINGALSGGYDLGMVSRSLTDYEEELLETKTVAEDEIVIVVNKENPVDYLTKKELAGIYRGTITSWEALKGDAKDE